jgi:hypothetical protein
MRHSITLKSILILSSNLRLRLLSSRLLRQNPASISSLFTCTTRSAYYIFLGLIRLNSADEYKSCTSSLWISLQPSVAPCFIVQNIFLSILFWKNSADVPHSIYSSDLKNALYVKYFKTCSQDGSLVLSCRPYTSKRNLAKRAYLHTT